MKKGILVKGAAVMLAAAMLTGCGALSAEDYLEEYRDAIEDGLSAMSELAMMQYVDEDDFDKSEAKELLDEGKTAFNSIKSLSAPKEIKDEHKELCKIMDYLMQAADIQYEIVLASVKGDDDKVEKLEDRFEDLEDEMEDKCDTDVIYDIEDELEELIEEEEDD